MRIRIAVLMVLAALFLSPASGLFAQPGGLAVPGRTSVAGFLAPGDILLRGQSVISPGSNYRMAFLPDGDLVVYRGTQQVWSAGIAGQAGDRLIMQHNGDLVIYRALQFGGAPVWRSGTGGFDGAELRLPSDGGATIRQHDARLLWSAGLSAPEVGLAGQQHIVYDRRGEKMMLWLVEADGSLTDSYPVSGRFRSPPAGHYEIYSKSLTAQGVGCCSMEHMVRFAWSPRGNRIGFHSIPLYDNGLPMQTIDQLGQALSGGCVRQRNDKAEFLYEWALIGTPVVVLG